MVNGELICLLKDEDGLCKNGFYLFGYILIGWVWVLILLEIVLDCVDVIQVRGCNYGESCLVCNVYWQSDIFEGCFMGVIVVVCLYDNVVFNKDLLVVCKEIEVVCKVGWYFSCDCVIENVVLKVCLQSVLQVFV